MAANAPVAQQHTAIVEAEGKGKSTSKTVTDTVTGEHEHTIVGYSLVKGIGDGEPIASERFTVGGHEWVLLFYPDGKRSSTTDGPNLLHHPPAQQAIAAQPPNLYPDNNPAPAAAQNNANNDPQQQGIGGNNQAPNNQPGADRGNNAQRNGGGQGGANNAPPQQQQQQQQANAQNGAPRQQQQQQQQQHPNPAPNLQIHQPRRELTNDYAALFVALIGETDNPQGVVNTSEGRVVRAFHRFTLVDQTGQGRDLTKGRRRDQGAVKISCARQDPNARNCHGYRKFVKRMVLEGQNSGYLLNDTLIIRYCIELVVSSGGALSKQPSGPVKQSIIQVPAPAISADFAGLLESGQNADISFRVEDETLAAHRIILTTRSIVFRALLNGEMREGKEGVVTVEDVRPQVFRAMLHYIYTDSLPPELENAGLDVAMAQHLLVAADRYQLGRLRRICERRLCETVEVATVATTMALAEQNHGEELKRVCLDFISRNLSAVMLTEGYQHMITSCSSLQNELLNVLAEKHNSDRSHSRRHPREHTVSDGPQDAEMRRVRQRRE